MKQTLIAAIVLAAIIYFSPRTKAQDRRNNVGSHTQNEAEFYVQPFASFYYGQGSTTETDGSANQSPRWYESPEWLLVFVGIITCGFIGWQSWATASAAQASAASAAAEQKSITLQEATFEQWLQISEWVSIAYNKSDGTNGIYIKFDVLNATKFPLIIREIFVNVPRHGKTAIADKHRLAPNEKHPYNIEAKISAHELQQWNGEGLELVIVGFIKFEGVLKKEVEWSLTGILSCRQASTSFSSEHITQDRQSDG